MRSSASPGAVGNRPSTRSRSRVFESRRIFEAVEDVQAIVEAALQSIDDPPVETAEMRLVEDLIESILPFDHKVQVPLAVVNVESK